MPKWKYLILIILIAGLILSGYTLSEMLSFQESTQRIVQINNGDSARTIGMKLKQTGIISSQNAFRTLAKLRRADKNLKPGTYIFGGRTNLWQTVSRLQDGISQNIRITFPEGLSLYKTLMRIDASGLADYQALYSAATDTTLVRQLTGLPLNSLEGFLYPETYLFPVTSSPDSILSIMTHEFFRRLDRQGLSIQDSDDFYKNLILASIVEKEAGNEEERTVIAGVFTNRMRIGMPLQSCPTVDYILEQRGIRREVLTNADTSIPSAYNTYVNPGLPPTPISNPRLESLIAAMQPAKHAYLYFFSNRQGKNVFSSSYEEHQRLQRQMKL
ncbi:MAG: endolytic transglycosylase MltG [Candidatus Cloacimonetes bacterium]|jgi:UPF0755 protein|nr:endolytic transglycosylase MltG [Candidatus Cloacimonadota bacterium]MDD3577667.1 endolytic transglycosylase MltG [Candidatus Cloacimonadota bacterium]MDY0336360.1 endolytic transglycosylase MltG [Candidatus Cloacimonadaceae bacterium]